MSDEPARPSVRTYLGVALTSGAAIAAQVAFTRVFAISLWHHFAYLVIGIALLGFGAAGSYLTSRGGALCDGDGSAAEALSRRAAIASLASFGAVVALATVRTNALALFQDPSVSAALAIIVTLTAIPFFGAGVVIGTALAVHERHEGSIYAADLAGAGGGAVGVAFALHGTAAPRVLFACAALLALAGLTFSIAASARAKRRAALALVLPALATAVYGKDEMWVRPAPAKEINVVHFPDVGAPTIEYRAWTPQGRIDVTRPYDSLPMLGGDVPFASTRRIRAVMQDGAAPTALYEMPEHPADLGFFPFATTAAVWEMKGRAAHRGPPPADGPSVLVIGFGGGVDGMMALAYGARKVTGVDINPAILRLHQRYRDFTGGLAERPGIELVNAEGRAFLRSTDERFDVIQLSGVDTFTALAAGAYTVAEAYVYTLEAFEDFARRLAPGGCLQMSRLVLEPPRETLRLAGTAAEALRRLGDPTPQRRIAIIRGTFWASLIVCERAIDADEMLRLNTWARARGFPVVFDPLAPPDNPFTRLLTSAGPEREAYVKGYPYRIDPATDEAPFFFDYYKWRNVGSVLTPARKSEHPYAMNVPIGHGLMLLTLLVTTLLGAIGIVRPLRTLGASTRAARSDLVYFAGLGVAFLFVEAALIQRLTFVLGHPTHAMTVVLGALLVASGLGSAVSGRVGRSSAWPAVRWVLVAALLGAAAASWTVLPKLVSLGFGERVLASLALVVPLGFVMGMPFPIGLSRIRASSTALVPWAFGVNAFFTVIASSVAPIIAMQLGFSTLIVLAAACYAVAFAATPGAVAGTEPPGEPAQPGSGVAPVGGAP